MTRIQAISLGPEIDVEAATSGVVHSVYHRAANFVVDGDMWTLLADDRGDLPFGVRISIPSLEPLHLCRGDRVSVRAGYVGIGSRIVVDCRSASSWSPHRIEAVAPGLERRLAIVADAIRGRSWSGSAAMARAVGEAIDDESALASVLAEVVGRGPGATPSGDDVLVGVFAVLRSPVSGPAGHVAGGTFERSLSPLLAGTTDLSRHLLRQAANGQFSRHLDDLVAAIVGSSSIAVLERSVRRVLETGATSGADMCEGLLAFAPSLLVSFREEVLA
jgi:hypothetical protein